MGRGFEVFGDSLDDLVDALRRVESHGAHEVSIALAQSAQGLVRDEFARTTGPDGQRWAPLKRPRPGGPVLTKTGRLRAVASMYSVDASGFVMRSTPYGGFHQTGVPDRNLPRRAFFPDDHAPLPLGWALTMNAAAEGALHELMQ